MTKINLIIIGFATFAASFSIKAQNDIHSTPIIMSLDSVISIAMQNNPILQSAKLSVTQQQKLRKTAWDFGKTGIFFENEDFIKNESNNNGVLKIGLTQTIDFPTSYFAQYNLNKQNIIVAESSYTLAQKEVLQEVRKGYFNLWFAVEKQKLILKQDSIFTDFENAATSRFQAGETNKLELLSAQAKHKEIQIALQSSSADIIIAQQEILKQLNSKQLIMPLNFPMQKLQLANENLLSLNTNHPLLNLFMQRITLADYQRKLAVNKQLPDFSMRYYNQSWYGVSPGYYGYSFGIGFPLFFVGQQGKIQGAKLQVQIAQKDYESIALQFNTGYNKSKQELKKQQQLLDYYETTGNKYAEEILNSAQIAFKNGEIGYIEYSTLLSQSIDIKNNYLTALANYNQAIIQINYYLNQ